MISRTWSSCGMWTWLTSVIHLFTASHAIQCPQMCDCKQLSNTQLKVDCGGQKVNESILVQEINRQLSNEELRESLRSLQIRNTSLTEVPISVCKLVNLTSLNLDHNRLTRLSDNCFTGMRSLQSLSARHNYITELQDGLFDGLNSLRELDFNYNQINIIGLHVFSNRFDLVNLKSILLGNNDLRSLEPWPYIRGLHGSQNSRVFVELGNNKISNFTNNLRWQVNCNNNHSYAELWLSANRIEHFSDILFGWDVPISGRLFCLFHIGGSHPSFEMFLENDQNYICDCHDFWLYTFQRHFSPYGVLQRIACSAPSRLANTLALQVPLNELECKLSDRCPSSCQCVYRPANATLHVYCSAANLSSLPLDLSPLPKSYARYKLDFSNNKLLRHLEGRLYFVNTSILDVSDCAITVVDINTWREIAKMQSLFIFPHINLQNNEIKYFPIGVTSINLTSFHLSLNHNPWECSCDNRWMIDWFKSLSRAFPNGDDASCASPSRLKSKSIAQSTNDDFCVDPSIRVLKISLSCTLAPVAVLLIFGFAVYRLRVRVFRGWKFHPFDRDECVGEDMDYDVFLCCSSKDHSPHGLYILMQMEAKGYRVCYHLRDFLAGGAIMDNMIQSIVRSKRTVCLVSSHFLER